MNPNGFDEILFRGIPANPNRRSSGSFLTSVFVHIGGLAVLLLAAPQIILNNQARVHFNTTLIAPPPEPEAVPKYAPPRRVAEASAPAPQLLRPLPRPAEPRIAVPKLEEAPALPSVPRPAPVLPAQSPVIHPPVQTGLFAANTPPAAQPKLPAAPAREAGFDAESNVAAALPKAAAAVPAGFDARPGASRAVSTAAVIQTGAFGETTGGDARATRMLAGKVSHTAFDARAENGKPAVVSQAIRKTSFDEPQVGNTPVKQTGPAVPAVRPVEILDKPKPAYTAEARALKIEGTVLLDVVFAATGEVRVLGVVRGLGHGLDENAADAARRIRFTPAKQAGAPVDEHVLLHVVFQITG